MLHLLFGRDFQNSSTSLLILLLLFCLLISHLLHWHTALPLSIHGRRLNSSSHLLFGSNVSQYLPYPVVDFSTLSHKTTWLLHCPTLLRPSIKALLQMAHHTGISHVTARTTQPFFL